MDIERNLPMEVYEEVKREITTLDIIIGASFGLGIGVAVGATIFALYLKHCQEHKGIIIREVK